MKKILVIAGIGIVVLVLAFFTWQHFSQTSNVPSKPHVIQSTKNTESQQGSKVVKEDIKNEKISTKNIECTKSFFTKKLDRENSGELSDIVGMHIDSNKIKIIEEESKIPENYEEVRCDSYLSHFIPKIKENKISFERSALEMTVFCEIKALPENLPRFYEQNFIKTECNFTSPVEVNFIEKNIESKKEKILNKEAFKLPHSVCKNMIDDYTRNTCYRIYQEDIIRKSQLNSYQTAFSRLNYSFKKEDKNKYILEFSSNDKNSILVFKKFIDEYFQGTFNGSSKTNWAHFDFYEDNNHYHFIITTSNSPRNLSLLNRLFEFYFNNDSDINLEIFPAIKKTYHFNTFPSGNFYVVDSTDEYDGINNDLQKIIPYSPYHITQKDISEIFNSDNIWNENKSFLIKGSRGSANFTFYLKPQDVEKVDEYFSKLK